MPLLIILASCAPEIENHIPEKHAEMSTGNYNKYLGKLKEAYKENDKIEAAVQLSNLKANKEVTFEMLNAGIKKNPADCEKVYEWAWMYDQHNFGINLVRLDTLLFKKSVKICMNSYKGISYQNYSIRRDNEEKAARESKATEDSTKFNLDLVRQLEEILFDDQEVRARYKEKGISDSLVDIRLKEMKTVDSINLIKVDKIFKEYGYPSKALVGRECNLTPALVIHHCADLSTRYRYMPFFKDAVSKGLLEQGTLNMIKTRNEHMEVAHEP